MNYRNYRRLVLPAVFLLATGLTGCRHMLREKPTPYPEETPHAAPWRLNREFLLPETSRIVFLVEFLDGRQPRKEPLDALVKVASRYGERPASWLRMDDPSAPKVEKDRSGQLQCPGGPLDPDTSYVFVRYAGSLGPGLYGHTAVLRASPECGGRQLYAMYIAQDSLRSRRFLWITQAKLEENDLIHEYGHVLGLGSNPGHGYFPYYPDLSSGDHCINPDCALAGPHPRADWYRALTFRTNHDFCADCLRDISMAKRNWRSGERFAESPRLPRTDLNEWIADLKDDDFHEGGRAVVLLYYGKEVMPALMKRIGTLPGSGEDSPSSTADWIAKTIVMQEALKRAGKGFSAGWTMGDQSRQMLWWWMKEGRRFMEGGEWALPSVVTVTPVEPPAGADAPAAAPAPTD